MTGPGIAVATATQNFWYTAAAATAATSTVFALVGRYVALPVRRRLQFELADAIATQIAEKVPALIASELALKVPELIANELDKREKTSQTPMDRVRQRSRERRDGT